MRAQNLWVDPSPVPKGGVFIPRLRLGVSPAPLALYSHRTPWLFSLSLTMSAGTLRTKDV